MRCVDDGYLDQNCRCVCPDGTDSCEVNTEKTSHDGDDSDDDTADEDKVEGKHTQVGCSLMIGQLFSVYTDDRSVVQRVHR